MTYFLEVKFVTFSSFSNKVLISPLKSKVVSPFENASEYFKILDNAFHTLSYNSRLIFSESIRALRPPAFMSWNFVFTSSTCRTVDSSVIGVTSSLIASFAQVRILSDSLLRRVPLISLIITSAEMIIKIVADALNGTANGATQSLANLDNHTASQFVSLNNS